LEFFKKHLCGLWLIFFICSKPLLFSQVHSGTEQDSFYILSLKHRPHLTFEFARRIQNIQIRNPVLPSMLVQYDPNTSTNFMASFDINGLVFQLDCLI